MAKGELLTRIEEVILTAIAAVEDQSYGMNIFDECRKLTRGRYISIGSIYTILDRLQKKGLVESWLGDEGDDTCPGGKRCFKITEAGIHAIRESAELSRSLRLAWKMIPISLEHPGGRPSRAKKALAETKLAHSTHRAS